MVSPYHARWPTASSPTCSRSPTCPPRRRAGASTADLRRHRRGLDVRAVHGRRRPVRRGQPAHGPGQGPARRRRRRPGPTGGRRPGRRRVHVGAGDRRRRPDALAALGLVPVPDRWPGEGPLGGLATALAAVGEGDRLVLAPCDLLHPLASLVEILVAPLTTHPELEGVGVRAGERRPVAAQRLAGHRRPGRPSGRAGRGRGPPARCRDRGGPGPGGGPRRPRGGGRRRHPGRPPLTPARFVRRRSRIAASHNLGLAPVLTRCAACAGRAIGDGGCRPRAASP